MKKYLSFLLKTFFFYSFYDSFYLLLLNMYKILAFFLAYLDFYCNFASKKLSER